MNSLEGGGGESASYIGVPFDLVDEGLDGGWRGRGVIRVGLRGREAVPETARGATSGPPGITGRATGVTTTGTGLIPTVVQGAPGTP